MMKLESDIICQIPPEYGYPPYIGARLKKPGYGLNDAPRRWWQIIDKALNLTADLFPHAQTDAPTFCMTVLLRQGPTNHLVV